MANRPRSSNWSAPLAEVAKAKEKVERFGDTIAKVAPVNPAPSEWDDLLRKI